MTKSAQDKEEREWRKAVWPHLSPLERDICLRYHWICHRMRKLGLTRQHLTPKKDD